MSNDDSESKTERFDLTNKKATVLEIDVVTIDLAFYNQMGKALSDALQLLPPGGSVRRNVEAAHKAYLESLK